MDWGLRSKLSLSAASLLSFALFIELGARATTGNWSHSFLLQKLELMDSSYPVAYDRDLGWIPRAGSSGRDNIWHTQVTIGAEGLRSNGGPRERLRGAPILAVGDSFTFGDEVSDSETWPAYLEQILGQPVLNAGVFGYGVDQTVLRANQLVPRLRPEWVVLAFITDDIGRCELSMRRAYKPYYRIRDGALVLENEPVPPPPPAEMDGFRRLSGYSWLAHVVMSSLAPTYWYKGRVNTVLTGEKGDDIVALLLPQFAAEMAQQGVALLVVVQSRAQPPVVDQERVAELFRTLQRSPAVLLDLHPVLGGLRDADPAKFESLFHTRGHMSAAGNRFVAEQVAAALQNARTHGSHAG